MMLLRPDFTLRTAALGCRLQPTIAASSYHTSRASLPSAASSPAPSQSRSVAYRRPAPIESITNSRSATCLRYASTTAPASATTASTKSTSASTEPLTWNRFFQLRKSRRRMQLSGSIFTAAVFMLGGAQGLAMSDMDAIVGQIPLDPFITLGLITFGCGGVGWLLGPIVGTGVFNGMNRKWVAEMAKKEKEFYARIKKYRVDPSASSMANPVPDYYGEKISSVQGYRQWLKDQRAFNKKRQRFV